MKTFLFQGDSITDVGRVRDWEGHLGAGYPAMAAGKIAFNHPGEFQFVNKGISGERSTGLYARCMLQCGSVTRITCLFSLVSMMCGMRWAMEIWFGRTDMSRF